MEPAGPASSSTRPIASPASPCRAGRRRRVEFLPGLRVIGGRATQRRLRLAASELEAARRDDRSARAGRGSDGHLDEHAEAIRRLVLRHNPAVITCVDRESLASLRGGSRGILHELSPTSSSSTNHSWAMPFPSPPSRPGGRCSPLESAGQEHFSLDDLPAQYDLDPAFHERPGQGGSRLLPEVRRGTSSDRLQPCPAGRRLSALLPTLALSADPRCGVRDERTSGPPAPSSSSTAAPSSTSSAGSPAACAATILPPTRTN